MWDRFWRWVPNTIDSDHLVKKRGTEWNKPLALAYFLYRCQIWTFQEKYNNFEKKFTKIDKKLVSQSILEVGHFISKKMVFFQNLICIGNPTVNLIYYVPLFFTKWSESVPKFKIGLIYVWANVRAEKFPIDIQSTWPKLTTWR